MKRVLISLFMIFSLLAAPVVCATGLDCLESGCEQADQLTKKKSDDAKMVDAGHHCCCNHIVDRSGFKATYSTQVTSSAFLVTEQASLASITVGPLLEPPSHS